MERKLLTPEEVAHVLKISKYTVYEMVKRGELVASRIGRKMRIDSQDLEEFVQRQKNEPTQINVPITEQVSQQLPITTRGIQPIMLMGSHDLAVDLLVTSLHQHSPTSLIIPAVIGSMEGLINLYYGNADLAGCHLFDEETGEYNLPFVQRLCTGEKMVVVQFVLRQLGWIVPNGNPQQLQGWEDLQRENLRFVNRQRGSGTRIQLDYQRKKRGIPSEGIRGYDREELNHYGVATAIVRGEADFGLGSESAARAVGLDFIPLVQERYDFIMRKEFYQSSRWQPLLQVLQSSVLRQQIEALGGYDTSMSGQLIGEVD
ncbi:helix-turn-helix transcriptional regulator [Rubeoparvulum massiliense]|uniref:helix-turn-helix transcriptional regulator n=1 Tax=Rubeoparvulum massiliense TaxID=1631346 RepID=UPI00065E8CC8|nr:helix-turn-helix transcriptional regulator [Rubeoparvulum massiliense]